MHKTASTDLMRAMRDLGERARAAYQALSLADTERKNAALLRAAALIRAGKTALLAANAKDMEAARAKNLTPALLDRLQLNDGRVDAIAQGLEVVAGLPDPVGRVLEGWDVPHNGLHIDKIAVPLGVIGIIYESRPNVTADAGALCIKSGNAAILRGGSESFHSSTAIVALLRQALREQNLPEDAIQLVPTTDREAVGILLGLTDLVDIIVPRGGKSLTERIARESRIPTIQHLEGNCHTYIHESADPIKALRVVKNAKLRRTGVCGATESLVLDAAIAVSLLPELAAMLHEGGCEIRGDRDACAIDARIVPASEEDWGTEYLDAIVSVKIVQGMDEALAHINRYGSHHTDAIIAEDAAAQVRFANEIDSAIVMVNASTQFADGGEFGFGAEIGISTGRLHARGPVGAAQLTSYKYVVRGDGTVRA
jgi:glutamate-5-semialdehyde dehydrogenase